MEPFEGVRRQKFKISKLRDILMYTYSFTLITLYLLKQLTEHYSAFIINNYKTILRST